MNAKEAIEVLKKLDTSNVDVLTLEVLINGFLFAYDEEASSFIAAEPDDEDDGGTEGTDDVPAFKTEEEEARELWLRGETELLKE